MICISVSIFITILIICFILINHQENFTSLNKLNNNNNLVYKFCKKLKLFDRPSENTILLNNFREEKLKKNKLLIKNLNKEIYALQKHKYFSDIKKVNDYKCLSQNKAEKQIKCINKARSNIKNRNTIELNLT